MQPIKVIDWQTAILLVLKNKARVIDAYDNVLIHSATQAYKLPSVLMIVSKNKRKKEEDLIKEKRLREDNEEIEPEAQVELEEERREENLLKKESTERPELK